MKHMLKDVIDSDFLDPKSTLTPLSGDAGTRAYHLVEHPSSPTPPQLLCVYKKDELQSLENFLEIHKVLHNQGLFVPQIYKVDDDQGWVLLEYLGDESLEQTFKAHPQSLVSYEKTIESLVTMQTLVFPRDFRFTKEKFKFELDFAVTHLSSLYALSLQSSHLRELDQNFLDISKILTSQEDVFCHRDFHSRNIHIKNGQPYLIDFQDARGGNIFYDLVSLLEDTYVQLDSEQKSRLKDLYCQKSKLSQDENFRHLYNLQALQRSLKACGSFASLKVLRGTSRYLPYLAPSFKNLRSYLKDLESYPAVLDFVDLCEKEEKHRA